MTFKKLKDIPCTLGNITGVEYDADIQVRTTTNEKLRNDIIQLFERKPETKTISLDKTYHVHKIKGFGDGFDVVIINDLGEEDKFGEWFFEDIE